MPRKGTGELVACWAHLPRKRGVFEEKKTTGWSVTFSSTGVSGSCELALEHGKVMQVRLWESQILRQPFQTTNEGRGGLGGVQEGHVAGEEGQTEEDETADDCRKER